MNLSALQSIFIIFFSSFVYLLKEWDYIKNKSRKEKLVWWWREFDIIELYLQFELLLREEKDEQRREIMED